MSSRALRLGRALAVLVAGSVMLSGCLFGRPVWQQDAPAPGPTSSTSASDQPSSSGSAGPSGSSPKPGRSTGAAVQRPVLPVPDVKPKGFTDPPPGQGSARFSEQKLDWSACGDYECATTKAPLDYSRPDGQAITLALKRKRATKTPRIGSLFINPGGPGASGKAYVDYFDSAGLERYDIVGWDPRGIGDSTPVNCFNDRALDAYFARDGSPDSAEEDAELQAAERAFGASCLERSGALLEHVSTVETARDLDLLRALVRDRKLNYFGSSYGTQIGATYAQLFPRNVGRLVLDGAVNITEDDSVSQAQGFDRALTSFANWCAARQCKLGSTRAEVLASITKLFTDLDENPMEGGQRPLTQQLAATGVLVVLYENERGWKYLQQALELAVVDKDPRYLLFLADQYLQRNDKTGQYAQSNFGFPAVRCLDSQKTDPAEVRREAEADKAKTPTLGVVSGPDYVCTSWPVAPAPKGDKITAKGAAPILVIGTTGDPATPYEYAKSMAQQLESGVLVTYKGEGHLAYGSSPCVRRIVRDYLVNDQVPRDAETC